MLADAAPLPPIDYLAIGHICHDLAPDGRTTGGAAAYGASTARALGCRAGIVTSAAAEDNWQASFPELAVHQAVALATTVFENVYTPAGRIQTIHAVASDINPGHIPSAWTRTPIVHLGPIANEVDPAIINLFSDSVVGVGPQGWMRRWDHAGHVHQVAWETAAEVLPLAAVTFVSLEDLADRAMLDDYRQLARILVVTAGPEGCTVSCRGETRSFRAPVVGVVDTTGAGDIFAAAYLVRLHQTDGNLWDAAEFANRVAARSVTQLGLLSKMDALRRLLDELMHLPAGSR